MGAPARMALMSWRVTSMESRRWRPRRSTPSVAVHCLPAAAPRTPLGRTEAAIFEGRRGGGQPRPVYRGLWASDQVASSWSHWQGAWRPLSARSGRDPTARRSVRRPPELATISIASGADVACARAEANRPTIALYSPPPPLSNVFAIDWTPPPFPARALARSYD